MKNSMPYSMILLLVFFSLFFFNVTGFSATYDATGTWNYSTSDNWASTPDCLEDDESGTAIIVQQGDIFSLIFDGITFNGTINGTNYSATQSYSEDYGTTTLTISFVLSSTKAGAGTTSWTYSAGGYSCNGGCNFTMQKDSSVEEEFSYYIPSLISGKDYWTGVALRNCANTAKSNITVSAYDQAGNAIETTNKTLMPRGQDAFIVASSTSKEGWIMVRSTQKLTGLAFIAAKGSQNLMFDMTLIPALSGMLNVPHVAQDATWDTFIMICNPNNSTAIVILMFVTKDGRPLLPKQYTIPPNGSGKYKVADLVQGGSYSSGSVEISSSQGVAAFALYHNLKTGGISYAGISAINPNQ